MQAEPEPFTGCLFEMTRQKGAEPMTLRFIRSDTGVEARNTHVTVRQRDVMDTTVDQIIPGMKQTH